MTDERIPPSALELEIVRRYAAELRQAACGPRRRPAEPNVRRCYELLNQCAMELSDLTRGGTQPRPFTSN